jgi:hypothetical protein
MARKLTAAQIAKILKARGLKATAAEVDQLTSLMNADIKRERQNKAVDRFFEKFWSPVRKGQRKAGRKKKK